MSIDFRNTNTLWASILVETLHRLGLKKAVISPGSRSTPLTVAFAQHPHLDAIPILDERSASFFALGLAKRSGVPVVLVCTSGTAAANFYPAIVEAKESRTPLLILTADRPPQLRHCHAGQTIDQVKLYGHYPHWQTELAVPSAEEGMLRYLRQTIIQAWERCLFPSGGVVHVNIPFEEPLAPVPQASIQCLESQFDVNGFFQGIYPQKQSHFQYFDTLPQEKLPQLQESQKGVIIAGVDHSYTPIDYCQAIADLSDKFNYPVLAEALSPVRNYAEINRNLICTYDLILRNPILAEKLTPEIVIQVGELPTSKELRTWLEKVDPQRYIIDTSGENLDALHGQTIHLRTTLETFVRSLNVKTSSVNSVYLQEWNNAESQVRQNIDDKMETINFLLEGKITWLISQILPNKTPIFIANSMPVRDAEFFWRSNNKQIIPYFNRGANGIDGTLSTALGIAYENQKSVMLTGDLALLHDTNGFLIQQKFKGHLTIILINNQGGGIFEILPISEFGAIFEDFFATPQQVNFSKLCLSYGIEHYLIEDLQGLEGLLNPLPETGIRVLEIMTNRKLDTEWLKNNLGTFSE